MNAILREANPAQRSSGERIGECLVAASALPGLPVFALWWAEYQQKMRALGVDSPGCGVVPIPGSPDQPIQESLSRHE